jgi:hypothetical protein
MHFRWSVILLFKEGQIVFQKKRVTDGIKYNDEKKFVNDHEN